MSRNARDSGDAAPAASCRLQRVSASGRRYVFKSRWVVDGTLDECVDLALQPLHLPRWWSCTFLEVEQLQAGGDDAVGSVLRCTTKGWMPHLIVFTAEIVKTSLDPPRMELAVTGEFEGTLVVQSTESDGRYCMDIEWAIEFRKRAYRWTAFLLWPLLVSNHRWTVAHGHKCLELELRRRRCRTDAERAAIPPPPRPTFPHHNWHRKQGQ